MREAEAPRAASAGETADEGADDRGERARGVEAEYPAFTSYAARVRARRDAVFATATALLALVVIDQGLLRGPLGRGLVAESFYLRKPPRFDEDPRGYDVLVTGDSRALHGIDPHAIEQVLHAARGEPLRVFNAGMPGAPPMAQYAWVRRALTHPARRPRVVVLSISPYMFSSKIFRTLARESLTTMYRARDLPGLLAAGAPLDDAADALHGGLWFAARVRPRLLELLTVSSGLRGAADFDAQGYARNGEVDPATQAERARGRALGYRGEMWRPEARFGNEHQGYFVQALRELRAAGVRAVVVNAPAASQMQLAYGPSSIYDEHVAWLRSTTEAHGGVYFDATQTPAITDEDFNDGDHLGATGAARYAGWLAQNALVPLLGGARALARPGRCTTLFDFESEALVGWSASGEAFREPTSLQGRRHQNAVSGYTGQRVLNSFARYGGDDATGSLASPSFELTENTLRLRVGGGAGRALRVVLEVDGAVAYEARGRDDETLRDVAWDVRSRRGRSATLRVVDEAAGPWGHLLVDDVALCER